METMRTVPGHIPLMFLVRTKHCNSSFCKLALLGCHSPEFSYIKKVPWRKLRSLISLTLYNVLSCTSIWYEFFGDPDPDLDSGKKVRSGSRQKDPISNHSAKYPYFIPPSFADELHLAFICKFFTAHRGLGFLG